LGVDGHEEELWVDSWFDGMMRLQMQIGLENYISSSQGKP
jgi:hypothetical protein